MDFRQYDPSTGRFYNIDLLAETTYNVSPYHFAGNNPVLFGDPSGLRKAGPTARVDDLPTWAQTMWNRTPEGGKTSWEGSSNGSFLLMTPTADGKGGIINGASGEFTSIEFDYSGSIILEEVHIKGEKRGSTESGWSQLDGKDWFGIGLGGVGAFFDIKGNSLHNDLYWKGKTTGKIYIKNPFTSTKVGWKANSFKASGKVFQGAKGLATKLSVVGLAFTAGDIIAGDGLTTSNILDATFGVAGFIPGVGWMISGSYFLINTGVQLYSGKSIGEHLDE